MNTEIKDIDKEFNYKLDTSGIVAHWAVLQSMLHQEENENITKSKSIQNSETGNGRIRTYWFIVLQFGTIFKLLTKLMERFIFDVDIQVEAKGKNMASEQLYRQAQENSV